MVSSIYSVSQYRPILDKNDFTIELWLNSKNPNHREFVLGDWDRQGSNGSGSLGFEVYQGRVHLNANIENTLHHWYYRNTLSTKRIKAGQWYHVAIVRNGSVFSLYLDGSLQGSFSSTRKVNRSSIAFTVGAPGDGNWHSFHGQIDDFIIIFVLFFSAILMIGFCL